MTDKGETLISVFVHEEQDKFIDAFNTIARQVHETAKSKGWWDNSRNDGEAIALTHSELSEALDGLRQGNPPSDKIPDYSAAEEELADAIIRIMDLSQGRGWRVAQALIAKLSYNSEREYRHGKKF